MKDVYKRQVQAMPDGGHLGIQTRVSRDMVEIAITDTGIGIAPENLQKVFNPFFTTKEVGKGTGLGLSVSFDIIEKHGGTVKVESQLGRGTAFTIVLPMNCLLYTSSVLDRIMSKACSPLVAVTTLCPS